MKFTNTVSATTAALILSLTSLLPSSSLVSAQDLTATLVTYSTNQCCGGSIAFNRVPAGRCMQSIGHPSIYGASLTVSGFWGNENISYGYLTGFKDGNCKTKAYEIRYEGCVSIDLANRAGSWSWTRETYVPPHIRRELNATLDAQEDVEVAAEGTKKPDYFAYFDESEGRERRIALDGSQDVNEVLKMYGDRDFAGLRGLYEYNRRR